MTQIPRSSTVSSSASTAQGPAVFTALVGITRTSESTLGQRSRRFVGVNLLARGGFLTDSFGGSSHDAGGEDAPPRALQCSLHW